MYKHFLGFILNPLLKHLRINSWLSSKTCWSFIFIMVVNYLWIVYCQPIFLFKFKKYELELLHSTKAHFRLGIGVNMGNLNIFWFIVWPQIINNILFSWGPMRSHVKPLWPKMKDQGFNSSYVFIFKKIIIISIFVSILKLNSKS
jgi:hypothetical protein